MVQGVHRGPTTGTVAAFSGVEPFQEGSLAACLNFSGKPHEAQKGPRSADGPFTEPGGRGHTALGPALAEQGPAIAAGAKVGARGVFGGHRQDSAQRDTATGGGHEPVTHRQVMPSVDPLYMGQPPFGGPPTRHSRIRTRRYRAPQQQALWQRVACVATARGP